MDGLYIGVSFMFELDDFVVLGVDEGLDMRLHAMLGDFPFLHDDEHE